MISVLFVSVRNTCRSTIAEAVFRDLVHNERLSDRILIDSAGTEQWSGDKAVKEGTIKLLTQRGILTNKLCERQLERKDIDHFNYIIAMDQRVLLDVQKLTRAASNKPECILLLELTDSYTVNVPEPHNSGDIEEIYDLIYEGCLAFLSKLKISYLEES